MRRDRKRRNGCEVVDHRRAIAPDIRAGAGADRSWIIPIGRRSSADPARRRRDDWSGRGRGCKRRRSNRHRAQRTRRHHSQRSEPARPRAVQQHYARPVHYQWWSYLGAHQLVFRRDAISRQRRIRRRGDRLPGAYSERRRCCARHQVRYCVQRECNQARLPGMRTIYGCLRLHGDRQLVASGDAQRWRGCTGGLRGDAAMRQAADGCGTARDDRSGFAGQRGRGRRAVHRSGAVIGWGARAGMSGMREHDDGNAAVYESQVSGGGETWRRNEFPALALRSPSQQR